MPSFLLVFDAPKIGTVPVEDLLKDPTRFQFKKLADPLEGVAYGKNKAMVMRRLGTHELFIRSYVHGGINYELVYDGAAVQDPDLVELNKKHAIIRSMGGKFVIATETVDPVSGETKVVFSKVEDFRNRYGNRKKIIKSEGNDKSIPMARWWLEHEQRREYEQVVFAPGKKDVRDAYNLWRGFAVKPDRVDSEAKCARYLAHIRDNISRGDKKLYDYNIKWMANGVQNPDRPGGAALVLRGEQGVGKGEFVRHYGKLFGPNYVQVYKPEQVTGRFNAHMAQAIVLFADEALFAGNPQHEPILKGLVTEKDQLIEYKGLDAVRARSCLHTIIATNDEWAVRVSPGDRRFCCMEVGNACKENHPY